jgi:photosystem II stability/assembly factor-like uncharacterized protein
MLYRSLKIAFFLTVAALLLSAEELAAQSNSHWDRIPEQVKERKPFKRFEWFYRQRALPFDTIPSYALEQARSIEKKKYRFRSPQSMALDVSWTPLGPSGVVSTFPSQWGVVSGRVRAIAVHPSDPNTLYIGVASGGIWKSTDGGSTWLDIGVDLASLTFGAIAIDPNDPNILYAGAGESMRYFNLNTYNGRGLYKSTDAGTSWTHITNGFGTYTFFSALKVDPTNSDYIYAALGSGYWLGGPSNEGLWRSTDAGITWTRTLNVNDAFDVFPHPTEPGRVYAATGGGATSGSAPGFYISTNHGATWTASNTGMPTLSTIGRMQIGLPASSPSTIYALMYFESDQMRLYKSTNNGTAWSAVSGTFSSGQGWYDLLLGVNPNDPNEVYIGDAELRRSTNGGSTFSYVGGSYWNQATHVDLHYMVFALSNPNIRYLGCDGGIYASTDAGATWVNRNTGLPTLQYYRISSHPTDENILVGGAQDNGLFKTTNGGSGTWPLISTGDGMESFFDYANGDTVYTSTQVGSLYKSTTGGNYGTFSSITPTGQWSMQPKAWTVPFFIHPTNNLVLYTASTRPWRSMNGGATWSALTSSAVTSVAINSMAQSPSNANNMILTGSEYTQTPTVHVSTNGGTSWTNVTSNIGGSARYIARVVSHPTQANTMFVVRSGFSPGNKIYRTTNLGSTWENITNDLPDVPHNDLFIDPLNTDVMYTGNDLGVYRSTNAGLNWVRQGDGMPYVPAIDFSYFNSGGTRLLRVATHGRSAYQTVLEIPPSVPTLASPGDGAVGEDTVVTFAWNAADRAARYHLQVSSFSDFSSSTFNNSAITSTSKEVGGLQFSGVYFWRVKAENTGGKSDWSATRVFFVGNDPLPIQLASFTGTVANGNDVILEWMTISEVNNYGFFVQRRVHNMPVFGEIPNVFIPGHGTTIEPQFYSWTDVQLDPALYDYRLRQVDLDGSHSFSPIVSVEVQGPTDVLDDGMSAFVFSLHQNYPNPFNPSTVVRYSLPRASHVSLKVFSILGQEVATLVNEQKQSGRHEVKWDARGVTSGMYFYRLQAGENVQTKKMILVK